MLVYQRVTSGLWSLFESFSLLIGTEANHLRLIREKSSAFLQSMCSNQSVALKWATTWYVPQNGSSIRKMMTNPAPLNVQTFGEDPCNPPPCRRVWVFWLQTL